MKYTLILLILCAACTFRKEGGVEGRAVGKAAEKSFVNEAPKVGVGASTSTENTVKKQDKELEKILHWFEQTDSIFREALWVIRKEKLPQSKSVFGKFERALLSNQGQKLPNKSLFKCDIYSMKRDVSGIGGLPQKAEVFQKCGSKGAFVPIGEWNHLKADELTMHFRGGNLADVLGFATSILSPKVQCKIKANASGIVEKFSCSELMLDYDIAKNQVLKFTRFEYLRENKQMLRVQAEVLENLEPVRKIEMDVPMEGKITVTETVLKAPVYEAKAVPAPTVAPPPPMVKAPEAVPPHQQAQENYNEQNHPQNHPQEGQHPQDPRQFQNQVPGYEPIPLEYEEQEPQQGEQQEGSPQQAPPPLEGPGSRQNQQQQRQQQAPQGPQPGDIPREQNTK